jgi:hypothetical protein
MKEIKRQAILRQANEEFFELEFPLNFISADLLVTIRRPIQRLQGYWLVYNVLHFKNRVHSIYHNYREFKLAVEKECGCEMIRIKTINQTKQ